MADINEHFKKGAVVEISSDDDGFRGAWYAGTVIGPTRTKNKVLVEYKTLTSDEAGNKPLRETLDVVQLRPPPPREGTRSFKFSEEVDAFYNDGWWEGVITQELGNGRYAVFFRATREQIEFGDKDLRLHREWVHGKWVPPFEDQPQQQQQQLQEVVLSTQKKPIDNMVKEKFSKGKLVEVSSDEDGFEGAWFTGTIIEQLSNEKFLIEYQNLRNDNDTDFLREVVDSLHIRPCPPETEVVDRFCLLEEVDALYNDGWWVGVISKVLSDDRYTVYFRGTNEEIEFKQSDIRKHQDWIDGKWVMASWALKF